MKVVVLALLLIACGASTAEPNEPVVSNESRSPSNEPEHIAPEEACEQDADCEISDFPGCCSCCACSTPYAIRGDALELQRADCAATDCADAEEECAAVECRGCPTTYEIFEAVCESGRCTRRSTGNTGSPEPGLQ